MGGNGYRSTGRRRGLRLAPAVVFALSVSACAVGGGPAGKQSAAGSPAGKQSTAVSTASSGVSIAGPTAEPSQSPLPPGKETPGKVLTPGKALTGLKAQTQGEALEK